MSLQELSNYIFNSKYAKFNKELNRRETWDETIDRVEQMMLEKYKDFPEVHDEIKWAYSLSRNKIAVGSQRCMQFGGVPTLQKNMRVYNCFGKETEFITSKGVLSFSELKHGDEIEVLTHLGNWKKAMVKNYGKQKLYNIKIKRGQAEYTVRATLNHRWITENGEFTSDIHDGNINLLSGPALFNNFDWDNAPIDEKLYWCYGLVYGDGTKVKDRYGECRHSMIRLCDHSRKFAYRFEQMGFKTSSPLSINGDFYAYTGTYLKTAPNPEIDEPRLIRAFVKGYLDADGEKAGKTYSSEFVSIQSSEIDHIEFIRKCFPVAGVYIVSETDITGEETNYGIRPYTIKFRISTAINMSKSSQKFKTLATDKNKFSMEDVWCLEVEDDESFVLPYGLTTGNCASTPIDRLRAIQEIFYVLLCGTGCGLDVSLYHIEKMPLKTQNRSLEKRTYVVPDTIEGWSDAVGVLLSSYFEDPVFPEYYNCHVVFDFSQIRPEGSNLSHGMGKAPGPEPLKLALGRIAHIIEHSPPKLRSIDWHDIVCHVADSVLAGSVRRSALLTLFSPEDELMMKAKTGNWFNENPQRARANNSIKMIRGRHSFDEYVQFFQNIKEFGEPGIVFVEHETHQVNPCAEILLIPFDEEGNSGFQMCNLCEINGSKVTSLEEWKEAARAATIIGTCQAGFTSFPYLGAITEKITKSEALLGVSITGMMDNPQIFLNPEYQKEVAEYVVAVNKEFAPKIGVNPTARATTVKPAGTSTPTLEAQGSGIHSVHSRRYFRRVQANRHEPVYQTFKRKNKMACEHSVWSANQTDDVITFCIEAPENARLKSDISAIEMLDTVKLTYNNWIKGGSGFNRYHYVSNTVHVKPEEWDEVCKYIYDNQDYLGGISLIPASGDKIYHQAPFCAVLNEDEIMNEYGLTDDDTANIVHFLRAVEENYGPQSFYVWDLLSYVTTGHANDRIKPLSLADNVTLRLVPLMTRFSNFDIIVKEWYNWELWCKLTSNYKHVDYSRNHHENVESVAAELACSSGKCEIL